MKNEIRNQIYKSIQEGFEARKKQGRDIEKLFNVIEKLANGEKLETKYHDHALTGSYRDCRECHVEPDLLLIYEIFDDILVLMLYRMGSHSELF